MSSPSHPQPEPDLNRRVLYVEHDPELCAVLPVLLTARGYQVETARDGNEAWIRICAATQSVAKPFDLMITDVDIPKLNGIELIRRVRDAGFGVRIVVYAAKLAPEQQTELDALMVNAVIQKGTEAKTLLNLIHKVLAGERSG